MLPEDQQAIVKAYTVDLEPTVSIAKRYGVTRQAILKLLKKAGVDTSDHLWPVKCALCGKTAYKRRCEIRGRKKHYCNQECYYAVLGAEDNTSYIEVRQEEGADVDLQSKIPFQTENIVHYKDNGQFNNRSDNGQGLDQKWSFKYDRCVKCGRNDIKHIARGLCRYCYRKETEKKYRDTKRKKYGLESEKKLTYEFIYEAYINKKCSLGDIAKECNASRSTILSKLKKFNIPRRTQKDARILALDRNKLVVKRVDENGKESLVTYDKIQVNETFFSSWSNEMAYVLGVIFTDGNITPSKKLDPLQKTTVRIPGLSIAQKEPELLNKILKLMDCDAKLYHRERMVYKGTVAGAIYWFRITSEKIYQDLINLGLTPNKSKTINFPDIPSGYVRHFIRGCWDGDGSVYVERRKGDIRASYISGSLNFLISLVEELRKAGLTTTKINKQIYRNKKGEIGYSYYIRYARENCRKLYRYLYEDVETGQYLERKYKIFEGYFGKLNKMINDYKLNKMESGYYYPRELFAIFELLCEESNYKITEAARWKLWAIFGTLHTKRDRESLNPQLVRNILEQVIVKQSKRVTNITPRKDKLLRTITEFDIPPWHQFC